MPAKLAEGGPIRVSDRETNASDLKSGLFYPYYSGLEGTIAKLYDDGTAAVTVDPESLPTEIRARHQKGTEGMRQKWLDGLSDEARNKLSAGEKKFSLRYTLLVGTADLHPMDQPAQAKLDSGPAPEPARKSLAELEADEARHFAEIAQKNNDKG